jgi:hypothetical protein
MNIIKLSILFIVPLFISVSVFGVTKEIEKLVFDLETSKLLKGETHFSIDIMGVKKLKKKYPQLATLDTTGFSKTPQTKMVLTKTAYIVKKPAGFFDHENIGSESFTRHYMGDQKVKKIDKNKFKIVVTENDSYEYQLSTFFDSDDISTLPNSKVIRAVTEMKKLDVISQSSTLVIFREFTQFTKYSAGSVEVSAIIPLKEDKTLIITYGLTAIKKFYAIEALLKQSFIKDIESQKNLINQY